MDRSLAIFISFALLFVINSWGDNPAIGSLTDSRDGRTYRTVKIGDQVWMAENLNFKTGGSWCPEDKSDACKKYGRLYSWKAALKACPAGWHLPSNREFGALLAFVSGDSTTVAKFRSIDGSWSDVNSGIKLKTSSGWKDCRWRDGNGTDDFSFSILPAGSLLNQETPNDGDYTGFWSSTRYPIEGLPAYETTSPNGIICVEAPEETPWSYYLNVSCDDAYWAALDRDKLLSVRCVDDASNETFNSNAASKAVKPSSIVVGTMKDSRDDQIYKTVKIGNQVWMAENLRYENRQLYSWPVAVGKSNGECYQKYCHLGKGKVKGLCPTGWHLPSEVEFQTLIDSAGGEVIAGRMLKSKSVWNGSDVDFSASFEYDDSFFWSSIEYNYVYATAGHLNKKSDSASVVARFKTSKGAIRCVKD